MDLSTITIADFKAYFLRDFPYAPDGATDIRKYVFDADISKAFGQAKILLNQSLFSSDANITIGYLYLTAHFLAHDIRVALDGIESRGYSPVTSRSVGNVSEAYGLPEAYTKNPAYAFYVTTGYGQKYLSLVLPGLVGNIGVVAGGTNP